MRASAHAMTFVLIAAPLVLSTAAEAGEDGKPIQVQTNFQINTGVAGVNPTMYTVPNGYELEIKFFSCEAQMPTGQVIFPNLLTTGGGGFAGFDFIPIKQATILGSDLYSFAQDVHIFADPGTAVVLEISDSSALIGGVLGSCSFAGELSRKH